MSTSKSYEWRNARPEMSASQFNEFAVRFHELSGINLPMQKKTLATTRILERIETLNLSSFSEYLGYLQDPSNTTEQILFCNALTTNLTSFFREIHHFRHFEEQLVSLAQDGRQRIRYWSAGCSSGEEAYSMAMTILASGIDLRSVDIKILATDLDTEVLKKASRGQYKKQCCEKISPQLRAKYLKEVDDLHLEICSEAKNLITFKQLNLHNKWPFRGQFDAIFCRNVLIYFDTEKKNRIIDRLADVMTADGSLYLGHSETILGGHKRLQSEAKTVYRRKP